MSVVKERVGPLPADAEAALGNLCTQIKRVLACHGEDTFEAVLPRSPQYAPLCDALAESRHSKRQVEANYVTISYAILGSIRPPGGSASCKSDCFYPDGTFDTRVVRSVRRSVYEVRVWAKYEWGVLGQELRVYIAGHPSAW